jgi:hypothetical protein
MEARGGCQKLNESTERYVFVLTDKEAMQLFSYTSYNARRITELGWKTRNSQCLYV